MRYLAFHSVGFMPEHARTRRILRALCAVLWSLESGQKRINKRLAEEEKSVPLKGGARFMFMFMIMIMIMRGHGGPGAIR